MSDGKTWKTPKGTTLYLLNFRGKDYLPVAERLIWFREEKPDWSVETNHVVLTADASICRATIKDETGRIIATATKAEDRKGFPDHIEKSETGSIGRALAFCGYGTQFCGDDLAEGERLADAPHGKQAASPSNSGALKDKQVSTGWPKPTNVPEGNGGSQNMRTVGDYVVRVGKKYLGKKLSDIPTDEIVSFMGWLKTKASQQLRDSQEAKEFLFFADQYLKRAKNEGDLDLALGADEFQEPSGWDDSHGVNA